jgi:hypothetical protein
MRKALFRAWDLENEKLVKCNQHWFSVNGTGDDDLFLIKGFELMACVGFRDKKKKLIYEGDVVKFKVLDTEEWETGDVTWENGCWKFGEHDIHEIERESCHVVGNIYEDWDLIQ